MDILEKDQRFSHVGRDPKFRSMPKKYKKVKIDKRFSAMFKDNRFKLKYSVDKRGRPVNFSSSEDLKRYYDADEGSDDEEEDDDNDQPEPDTAGGSSSQPEVDGEDSEADFAEESEKRPGVQLSGDLEKPQPPLDKLPKSAPKRLKKKASESSTVALKTKTAPTEVDVSEKSTKKKKKQKQKKRRAAEPEPASEEEEEEELAEPVRERLMDLAVDYARGGGRLQEDSSSDDESEPEQVEVEHDWAELDRDAPRIDDSETTARLAVCNMDWDRIKAQDLMVLLSSFAPPGGVIREVAIYPSEFGKKRMAEEEERGPSELFGDREEEEEEDKDEDDSSDDERKADPETAERDRMEFVRRYQLSRLRYFYAVVSCDSRQTAGALYDQCEGLEFESSASRVDLRFIPDGMEFDEEPRERCSAVPEAGRYRPSTFVTTALQQRLVRFTWDETDADRQETVRRAAQAGDIEDADIRAYLADSSDDEQPDEDEEEEEEKEELDRPEDEKARIAKYRALLADADDQDRKEEGDVEMEITWGVGIKEKTEEIVKKKEQQKDQTPWEKYIDKQKAKKKAKSAAQKETATAPSDDSDSDSDIPSDLADDPFFKEELDARRKDAPKQTKKVGKGKQSAASEEDQGDKDQLALLTMDDGEDDGRRHFNFKQIVKDETTSGKKKKWKKKRKPAEEQKPADDFEVDVADPRFSQLYDSAEFNVDPSDARFKRTAGMERLVGEKQRRLASGETRQPVSDGSAPKKARLLRPAEPDTEREAPDELSALVNTIKAKAKHAKRNKAKSGR